jgi:hypothetical protein
MSVNVVAHDPSAPFGAPPLRGIREGEVWLVLAFCWHHTQVHYKPW